MRRMTIAAALLLLIFTNVLGQKKVARVKVRADVLKLQPADKPYVIDLTSGGKVYTVPSNIDHSRIRVRTQSGEVVLKEIMKRMGISGAVTIGMPSDLRAVNFMRATSSGRGLSYYCGDDVCICRGFSDCIQMNVIDEMCRPGTMMACTGGVCACVKK